MEQLKAALVMLVSVLVLVFFVIPIFAAALRSAGTTQQPLEDDGKWFKSHVDDQFYPPGTE